MVGTKAGLAFRGEGRYLLKSPLTRKAKVTGTILPFHAGRPGRSLAGADRGWQPLPRQPKTNRAAGSSHAPRAGTQSLCSHLLGAGAARRRRAGPQPPTGEPGALRPGGGASWSTSAELLLGAKHLANAVSPASPHKNPTKLTLSFAFHRIGTWDPER